MNVKEAYKLFTEKSGYTEVTDIFKFKDSYVFAADRGEDMIIDDGGIYEVNCTTGEVKEIDPMNKFDSGEDFEELDPNILKADKLFNL